MSQPRDPGTPTHAYSHDGTDQSATCGFILDVHDGLTEVCGEPKDAPVHRVAEEVATQLETEYEASDIMEPGATARERLFRRAFEAGAATRRGEVDRLKDLLNLYRAARGVGPGDQQDRYLDSLDEQLVEVFGE